MDPHVPRAQFCLRHPAEAATEARGDHATTDPYRTGPATRYQELHTDIDRTSKKGRPRGAALFERMSGSVLLSHKVPLAVPSALRSLASGFGMGPGVSLSL